MTVTHQSGGYPMEVPPEHARAVLTQEAVETAKVYVSMMWRFVQVR